MSRGSNDLGGHNTEDIDEKEEEERGEAEAGKRSPMKKLYPKEPTVEERKTHELTHLPFRNWCRHCIRGKGKEEPCQKQENMEENMEEIHMDFMFMGEEKENVNTLTFLVAKEKNSKMVLTTVTPRKSTGE